MRNAPHSSFATILSCVTLSMACVACTPKSQMKLAAENAARPVASGIEGMRWVVGDDARVLHTTISAMLKSNALHECENEALRGLGFFACTLDDSTLDALLSAFGGTPALERVWFGQVSGWKSVATVVVPSQTPLSIDGRSTRGDARLYQLSFRGWTLPTLEGSACAMEFRVTADSPSLSGLPTGHGDDASTRGTLLGAILRLEVPPNTALVLLANPAYAVPADTGPDVLPPATIADVLLKNQSFKSRREVLVFLPRFADTLPTPLRTLEPAESPAPQIP